MRRNFAPLTTVALMIMLMLGLTSRPSLSSVAADQNSGEPSHLGHFSADDADSTEAEAESDGEDEGEWDIAETHGPSFDISFTTTEATWMSVDVSPDGATLLFDILGDIYTMPIEGGQATRLLGGRAWDYQPRWSPDGSEFLFTSDRAGSDNIWIAKADGSEPKALTEEKDKVMNCGAWSPDGEAIVAKRRLTDGSSLGTTELWMYDRRGGAGIQITKKDARPEVSEPVFHPEGRFVFFSNRNARFRYDRNVHQGIYEIHRYDRQTGEFSRVAANFGGAGRPAVSPDGNWLSFITRDNTETHLVLQDLRSGAQRVLWTGLDRDMQETFAWAGVYPSMDWTPDGEAIVCYARGKLWSVDVKSGDASEIALSASVELTAEEAVRSKPDVLSDTFQAKILRWVQQNPESGELVFSALGRLYRADADGANPSILLKDDDDSHLEYSPNFSRDGKKIAYVSWNDNEKGQLWISNANGGGAKQLTEMPGQYANPAFSRDGKKIVYLKGSGATLRGDDIAAEMWLSIYTIDTKGGEPTFVTTVGNRGAQARMSSPTFSSSGDRIYYMQAGGGNNAVQYVSVRLDGTDERTHATVDYGEEITMSPDGRWIAYKQHHDAYVAPIGIAGVNELALGTSDGAVKVKQLSDGLADWIHWTDDNTVTWAVGPTLAVQTMDKAWAEVAETEKGEDDETEDDDEEEVDPNAAVNIDINLEITRHRPEGVLALTNLRLITMKGDQVIDDGVVVIRGNRIAAVGRVGGEVEIPEGAKIVDARGMTAIPGLVDAHAHMGYNGLDINPQKDWQYYANLAYGVTTTMDPSASTQLVFTQAEMVEAGVMKGPRIYSTGFILYGADIPGNAPTNSLDDARKHMKRQKTLGAFAVKSYMQPRREQRQWYIKAAREENMLVFPEGGGNFEGNMGMVLDGHTGIEHTMPPANLYNDVVQFWSATKVGYTPTFLVSYGGISGENYFYQNEPPVWKDEKLLRFTPRQNLMARARRLNIAAADDDWNHMLVAASAKKLLEAGVLVNLGQHGQRQGLGCHWDMWALSHGGSSNHDVLRFGTIFPATYIGLGDELGSIEVGKIADLAILGSNPLDDIQNTNSVRYVIKNGELFNADSMDQQWPVEEELTPFLCQQ